jgi:hypothetical protein
LTINGRESVLTALFAIFFMFFSFSDAHAVGVPSLEASENESVNDDEKIQMITSLFLLLIFGIGGGIYEYFRRRRKNKSK